MALLHYENLGVHRPDVLLRLTFNGLRDFYEYLKRTLDHLNSESVVLRLSWARAPAPDDFDGGPDGFWIELKEPDDRPNEPDRTFDTFLDEDVKEVFEKELASDPGPGRPKRVDSRQDFRLRVLDRDPKTNRLLLDREPTLPELFLKPNTGTLKRQLDAVKQLQDAPAPSHMALLRLFEQTHHARWPAILAVAGDVRWQVLSDPERPGTEAQRSFVKIALETPDFAVLEGPPGSGKTTAICELVLQLVGLGKRVLLCASTHVAVDNVLERLGPLSLRDESELMPVRIGERRKVSDRAKPFQLENIVFTERQRLLKFLRAKAPRSPAQEDLFRSLSRELTAKEPGSIERMVLDAANLVCGTTAGVLHHPDIRTAEACARAGMFDVLILDEASKTTFQEFLVPALLAKRWIIVGDARQLSPFIEEEAVAANLTAAVPDEVMRNACVDVFLANHHDERKRRAAVVAIDGPADFAKYVQQAAAYEVEVRAPGDNDAALAHIVCGTATDLLARADHLPGDVSTVRGVAEGATTRRAAANRRANDVREEDPPRWEDEMAWRICRHYELRRATTSTTASRILTDIKALQPVGTANQRNSAPEQIDRVRRVAFPSVLESLQSGFERREGQRDGTALTDGLPRDVFKARHVLLEYQHRMHPEISAVPREKVYDGVALKDPHDMATLREWSYPGYQRRGVWLHVDGRFESGRNRNPHEAEAVIEELGRFRQWAQSNPRPRPKEGDAGPWEVALLTFYRGQERELRERLRRYAKAPDAYHHFELGTQGRVDVRVDLCTVDRFQGHEADVVFLSVANTHHTNFLESVNRLNVAITRARYQRVIVGNRMRLKGKAGSLLSDLASNEPWELAFGGVK